MPRAGSAPHGKLGVRQCNAWQRVVPCPMVRCRLRYVDWAGANADSAVAPDGGFVAFSCAEPVYLQQSKPSRQSAARARASPTSSSPSGSTASAARVRGAHYGGSREVLAVKLQVTQASWQ